MAETATDGNIIAAPAERDFAPPVSAGRDFAPPVSAGRDFAPPVSAAWGPPPVFGWLAVSDLVSDPAYQRSIAGRRSQQNIAWIVEHFTWALFGAPTVARDGEGRLAVIDGQHRIEAARRLGMARVPCLTVEAASMAAAAGLFVEANRRRVGLTPMAIHHAMVAAGDAEATAIDRACREAGVEVLRYPVQLRQIRPGQTMAIGALRTVLRKHGQDVLTAALRLAVALWPGPGGVRAERIRGIAEAVATVPRRAAETARALGPAALERAAEAAQAEGRARWLGIAHAVTAPPPKIAGATEGDRRKIAAAGPGRGVVSGRPAPAKPPGLVKPVCAPVTDPPPREHELSTPVHRKCTACGAAFQTRLARRMLCEGCRL